MLKSGVFFMTAARPNFYHFPRYKTEIPQCFTTNKCKTVWTVDKTRIGYLNCSEKVTILLVSHNSN
jgi:hypothetical protein